MTERKGGREHATRGRLKAGSEVKCEVSSRDGFRESPRLGRGRQGRQREGISESDSLSEDRINRVHEVSEEVTWLLSREQLLLVICLLLSRLPFVIPARVRGLPRRTGIEGIQEKRTKRGGESEGGEEGESGDNNGKRAVTFDSSVLYMMRFVGRVRNTRGPLPPDSFIISRHVILDWEQ